MAHWSAGFVGLPFADRGRVRAGLDCWGLVRLVYSECRGIDLPSYTERYASTEERRQIGDLLTSERAGPAWREVSLADPHELDVLLFSAAGRPMHVGLVARPGLMLHVSAGHDSRIEPYSSGRWRPRLLSLNRYCL